MLFGCSALSPPPPPRTLKGRPPRGHWRLQSLTVCLLLPAMQLRAGSAPLTRWPFTVLRVGQGPCREPMWFLSLGMPPSFRTRPGKSRPLQLPEPLNKAA